MIKILGLTIDHVTQTEKEIAEKAAGYTIKIHELLNSGQAISAADIIPEGEPFREKLIELVDKANAGLQALLASGDIDGVLGRLQRLGSQLAHALHGDDSKGLSHWIHIFEAVINVFLGKGSE